MEHKDMCIPGGSGLPSRYFLFLSGEMTPERARWISCAIRSPAHQGIGSPFPEFVIYLTGDSLISLADTRTAEYWNSILRDSRIIVHADGEELRLHGLIGIIRKKYPGILIHCDENCGEKSTFWDILVRDLTGEHPEGGKAGVLLCQGPYMSRTPVFMLRFLKSAVEQGIQPELYAYLDGVHAAHLQQHPSEFENIGDGISALSMISGDIGAHGWFGACSRCATARGYFVKDSDTGACRPSSCIPAIQVKPLREILERFNGAHPILALSCGGSFPPWKCADDAPLPLLTILITCSPYMSEWAFGGLSMAVATAMSGMETRVLFIDQGVYALYGDHTVIPEDRVFNVQEMIMATMDLPFLHYAVYSPSLSERGLHVAPVFKEMPAVSEKDLGNFLYGQTGGNTFPGSRLIFF